MSPHKEELVLRSASFSTLLPLGLKVVVLTALPESGFGHHHTILFKIVHLSCDLVVFYFLFPLHLFVGSSQHQEDRNKQLKCLK